MDESYSTNEDASLSFRRAHSSYLDASAFLELERGMSEKNKKELDGIEAAILASSPLINGNTSASMNSLNATVTSKKKSQLRISKASLDKISAAAKAGSLSTFGSFREETLQSMDSIRDLQEKIFQEHMRFDVFENNEVDLTAKDFLPKYTQAHESKEKTMQEITGSLIQLANQITEAGAQLVGVIDPLSSTATTSTVSSPNTASASSATGNAAPKLSLKTVTNKLIATKRLDRAKRDTRLKDLVHDAKMLDTVNQNLGGFDL